MDPNNENNAIHSGLFILYEKSFFILWYSLQRSQNTPVVYTTYRYISQFAQTYISSLFCCPSSPKPRIYLLASWT